MKQNWTLDELIDKWRLNNGELMWLNRYKTRSNRLVVAILLKYFQIDGRFPYRPQDIPETAIGFIARQLNLPNDLFAEYDWQNRSGKRHRADIRDFVGFREGTVADSESITAWLVSDILLDEPSFDKLKVLVLERYRRLQIEPPTSGRIERLIRSAQRQFTEQFCTQITAQLSDQVQRELDHLLKNHVDPNGDVRGYSSFAFLKQDAGAASLKSVMVEIEKVVLIDDTALPNKLFNGIPQHVVQLLRSRVEPERPSEVRKHQPHLRYTLLAAFCYQRGQEIRDNLIDLFIDSFKRIDNSSEKTVNRKLLQEIRRIRGKGRLLCQIARASVDKPDGTVSDVIYPVANEETLSQIINEYEAIDTYEMEVQQTARRSYGRHYRRMIPSLFDYLDFRTTHEALQPLLDAVALIRRYRDSKARYFKVSEDVPLDDVIPSAWRDLVVSTTASGKERVNRISYELCVFQKLRDQLRCRAVWVEGADRYRNPDEDLPPDFEEKRSLYHEALHHPQNATEFINRLRQMMVDGLAQLNDGLANNAWLTLESKRKRPIILSPLPAQAQPINLHDLKQEITRLWPMTPLLDMLKEADLRINFTRHFQTSGSREMFEQTLLHRRLLLCLYALGTNTGYKRMEQQTSADALRYIRRRFITKANLKAAIAAVVDALFNIRHPHVWGNATTACASDSKKFAAWDQNLLTEWHVRYRGPGIMVYWHIDKKAACIHSQVKRCSSSEVAAMIEGVLHHCTTMSVDKNYVDSHGQSTVAFAFCHLLGFQLMPRLKPISSQKLYQPYSLEADDYTNLKPILTRPIRWELIEQHYDDMIRYATALRLGTADAESILQRFTKYGIQHPIYKALVELGRAVKTVFLCNYLHSLEMRREIQEGLNVVENWNSANSFIFFGRRSEISTNNRPAQELSVLSLHLLQLCMVYINTLMIQNVLLQPSWVNRLQDDDLRALTPLIYSHVNPYGRFDLDMNTRLAIEL